MKFLADDLTLGEAAAHVERRAPAQVGQREVGLPVAAIHGAEEREERLVLVDRQQLPVTERPAFRRKDERHNSDFGKKWIRHRRPLFVIWLSRLS